MKDKRDLFILLALLLAAFAAAPIFIRMLYAIQDHAARHW